MHSIKLSLGDFCLWKGGVDVLSRLCLPTVAVSLAGNYREHTGTVNDREKGGYWLQNSEAEEQPGDEPCPTLGVEETSHPECPKCPECPQP